MTSLTVKSARQFVDEVRIPSITRERGQLDPALAPIFDAAKNQALVVGSDIVSFVSGVTAERREAIANSSLLAQLVAKLKVPDNSKIKDWYDQYFSVLENIGWIIQRRDAAVYNQSGTNVEVHEAIMDVAGTVLVGAPVALKLVATTLNALKKMEQDSPWITLFNRESQTASTAHFQVSLAHQEPDGQFLVTLMAFGLQARETITQVLFFKIKQGSATLSHYSGDVTINTGVLDSVRDALRAKLAAHSSQFIAELPNLR